MERQTLDAGRLAQPLPLVPEGRASPGPAVGVGEDQRAHPGFGIERRLQWAGDADDDRPTDLASLGLGLPQPDVHAIIGAPWQPQEIPLALSGPDSEQGWQAQALGRTRQEALLLLERPHVVGTRAAVELPGLGEGIDGHKATVDAPIDGDIEHSPSEISLPGRLLAQL